MIDLRMTAALEIAPWVSSDVPTAGEVSERADGEERFQFWRHGHYERHWRLLWLGGSQCQLSVMTPA